MIRDLPTKFRNYLIMKLEKYNQNEDENYDDFSSAVSPQSTLPKEKRNRKIRKNDEMLYNSHAETLYNGSVLSDCESSSLPPNHRPPPPPPPPPIPPKHNSKQSNAQYSDFYDPYDYEDYSNKKSHTLRH